MTVDAPNYQYPEDAPHVSGNRGTAALVVRKDALASLADTDGDYALLQVDDAGRLQVRPGGPIKFARINASSSGNTLLVSAVVGKRVRVLGYMFTTNVGGAGIDVEFRSGATTVLVGPLFVDKGIVISFSGSMVGPAFETAVGEDLNLNLTAAGKQVQGHLSYLEGI